MERQPLRLISQNTTNHLLSPTGTVLYDMYNVAKGQFLLASELVEGTCFTLTLSGLGILKLQTFPSSVEATSWMHSEQPMPLPCQRIHSKPNTRISFEAICNASTLIMFPKSGMVKSSSRNGELSLRLTGESRDILAFDIEFGDIKVSVTDMSLPSQLVDITSNVFHPLHSAHLDLTTLPNGSQVSFKDPHIQNMCRVSEGGLVIPDTLLVLLVGAMPPRRQRSKSSRSCATEGYFRLTVTRKKQSSEHEQEQNQDIPRHSSPTQKSYVSTSSIYFTVAPHCVHTYTVVVKPTQLIISYGCSVKDVIPGDFQQYDYTLWIEFYKVALNVSKTVSLSWDWPSRQETSHQDDNINQTVDNFVPADKIGPASLLDMSYSEFENVLKIVVSPPTIDQNRNFLPEVELEQRPRGHYSPVFSEEASSSRYLSMVCSSDSFNSNTTIKDFGTDFISDTTVKHFGTDSNSDTIVKHIGPEFNSNTTVKPTSADFESDTTVKQIGVGFNTDTTVKKIGADFNMNTSVKQVGWSTLDKENPINKAESRKNSYIDTTFKHSYGLTRSKQDRENTTRRTAKTLNTSYDASTEAPTMKDIVSINSRFDTEYEQPVPLFMPGTQKNMTLINNPPVDMSCQQPNTNIYPIPRSAPLPCRGTRKKTLNKDKNNVSNSSPIKSLTKKFASLGLTKTRCSSEPKEHNTNNSHEHPFENKPYNRLNQKSSPQENLHFDIVHQRFQGGRKRTGTYRRDSEGSVCSVSTEHTYEEINSLDLTFDM